MAVQLGQGDTLFEDALDWLRGSYAAHRFYVERDIVWTIQQWLVDRVASSNLPLRIFNDYPMLAGKNRSLSADLCMVARDGTVEVAAEFKFEPGHARPDIQKQKLPVVLWGMDGVAKDVERVRQFVNARKAKVAYSVFIDEGRAFRHRPEHAGSKWVDWDSGPSVLYLKVVRAPD